MTMVGDSLLEAVARQAGEARALGRDEIVVDGIAARVLAAPDSLEAASALMSWASAEGIAIIPRGGGTKLALGNRPRAADVVLSTERLNGILEYSPADLTVTVQAGTQLADIQRTLGEHGQFLPLDPPFADRATIGGIVATNALGPYRARYGSARDLVIGSRVVNPTGEISKAGGKVVKNVTGYDLNKLYVGSLGTVGLIAELTFKVQPLPRSRATVVARFGQLIAATEVAYKLVKSPLTPAAVVILTPATAATVGLSDDGYALIVEFGGFDKPVARQVASALELAARAIALETPGDEAELWLAIRELAARTPDLGGVAAYVKVTVPISQVAPMLAELERPPRSESRALAHYGSGTLFAWIAAGDDNALTASLRRLRAIAREREGHLVVEQAPLAVKRQFDVWGEPGAGASVMRRLKATLDPAGIMNPGRFVDGI